VFIFSKKEVDILNKLIEIFRKNTIHSSIGLLVIIGIVFNFLLAEGQSKIGGPNFLIEDSELSEKEAEEIIATINSVLEIPLDYFVSANEAYFEKPLLPFTVSSDLPRDKIIVHQVLPGETLWTIAYKYEISIDSLRWSNNIRDVNSVKVGQKLLIPPVNGIIHKVKQGETLGEIARAYQVKIATIKEQNHLASNSLTPGQMLVIPGAKLIGPLKKLASTRTYQGSIKKGKGNFIWPVSSNIHYITQYFSRRHPAIDLDSRNGRDIMASDSGTVVAVTYGWGGGYGNHVIIDHGNGFQTLYAHLAKIYVNVGDDVEQGQVIGLMGATGRATGVHLHFEIRVDGRPLNPLAFLK